MTLAETAARFIKQSKAEWADLCLLAPALTEKQMEPAAKRLAQLTRKGKKEIRRKLEAVKFGVSSGLTIEQLQARGQERVLGDYIKSQNGKRTEGLAILKWRIAPDLKLEVQKECWRIAQTLKITTSDELWSFLHSVLVGWTKEEILHLAGDERAVPKPPKPCFAEFVGEHDEKTAPTA